MDKVHQDIVCRNKLAAVKNRITKVTALATEIPCLTTERQEVSMFLIF